MRWIKEPQEKAKLLLNQPSPFSGMEEEEDYDLWLKAQSGDNNEFYDRYLRGLAEFNERNLRFERISRSMAG